MYTSALSGANRNQAARSTLLNNGAGCDEVRGILCSDDQT